MLLEMKVMMKAVQVVRDKEGYILPPLPTIQGIQKGLIFIFANLINRIFDMV